MKRLQYNKEELIEFFQKNCAEVPILATPFSHKVIIAETALKAINEQCNISQDQFQEYLDGLGDSRNSDYERDEFIDNIICSIEYPGIFKTLGWEKIGENPYIFLHKILKK